MSVLAVVADREPVIAAEPGDGSFDDPAVPAEVLTRLDSFASDSDADASIPHPVPQFVVVIGLSACNFPGLRRRGPRRERIAGIARTNGRRAAASGMLASETATVNGIPVRSDSTCSFEPDLPRSRRIRPGHRASSLLEPTHRRRRRATSRANPRCRARRARRTVGAAIDPPRSRR